MSQLVTVLDVCGIVSKDGEVVIGEATGQL